MQKKELTYNDIYDIISNYHWMVRELHRLSLQLNSVETVGVASYSDEPKGGMGEPSRRVEGEVIRRDRKRERMERYAWQVEFIRKHQEHIESEQDKVVFDCMLDGMRINAIARHLSMNRKTVQRIRDRIIERMVKGQFVAH